MMMTQSTHRIVLTGGGTGGHLYPALALAGELQELTAVEALLYIGNSNSLESRKVPEAGFSFHAVPFRGMPRGKNPFAFLSWVVALLIAGHQARVALQAFGATAVIGTGGYVAAPVLFAAAVLRIPYFIHEPDAIPGLVNKIMAKWATRVSGAFPNRAAALGIPETRYTCTGNPLRGNFTALPKAEALKQLQLPHWHTEKPTVVIVGGSQGARTLNTAVIQALPTLITDLNLQVLHQCGETLATEAEALHQQLATQQWTPEQVQAISQQYHRQAFFNGMDALWTLADIAVCRAGSLTLSELYLSGTPAILVPYPYAAANHQEANARLSEAEGAAQLLLDADCTPETLIAQVKRLMQNPEQLATMHANALRLAKPHATQTIIDTFFPTLRFST
jgi:UDP-N-acetylglucosamine--N-acetylmuramyl-(pentapeptide) pyrophosphoryl-undecaprenol N-acetylglucosamine transferase